MLKREVSFRNEKHTNFLFWSHQIKASTEAGIKNLSGLLRDLRAGGGNHLCWNSSMRSADFYKQTVLRRQLQCLRNCIKLWAGLEDGLAPGCCPPTLWPPTLRGIGQWGRKNKTQPQSSTSSQECRKVKLWICCEVREIQRGRPQDYSPLYHRGSCIIAVCLQWMVKLCNTFWLRNDGTEAYSLQEWNSKCINALLWWAACSSFSSRVIL